MNDIEDLENNQIDYEEPSPDMLDDDYLISLHRRLQLIKKERIRAEQDTQLLDGRVKCLKNEQEKTLKKIAVTRKKTEDKELARARVEDKIRAKEEFRRMKELELQQKKEQNQNFKDANRAAILQKQKEMRNKLEEDLLNLREQKKINLETKKLMEIEDQSNKKTQADYIKKQQIVAEEKRRAIDLEKKNKIKEDLQRKIFEEEERIHRAELKKQKLEEEEIQVMQNLKTTTQLHESLVENYEKLNQSNKKK